MNHLWQAASVGDGRLELWFVLIELRLRTGRVPPIKCKRANTYKHMPAVLVYSFLFECRRGFFIFFCKEANISDRVLGR